MIPEAERGHGSDEGLGPESGDNLPVLPRFYVPGLDRIGEITLPADEGRHLARVLRLHRGDRILVFDGRGREWIAEVAAAERTVRVRILEPTTPVPEPRLRIVLAHGLLKGAKEDDLVRDATMLGVAGLRPMWSAHTALSRSGFRTAHALERWRRIAVASCKQCGRAVVPDVFAPGECFELMAADRSDLRLLLVEPGARVGAVPLSSIVEGPRPGSATFFVGPEGGWSGSEIDQAISCGARPIRLGSRTLRADAVPIVAMTALLFAWGEL